MFLRRKDIAGSPWDDITDMNGNICVLWIISEEESVKTFVPLKIKLTPVNGGGASFAVDAHIHLHMGKPSN